MEFSVDAASRVPISAQLTRQVREGLARGMLRPAERLPSVRELSRALVVNPHTVGRAYAELEREGLLQRSAQGQVFVAEVGAALHWRARRERLTEAADRFLTEAVLLGAAPDEAIEVVAEQVGRFEWRGGAGREEA
jgi:GntR family transcriptional regulator